MKGPVDSRRRHRPITFGPRRKVGAVLAAIAILLLLVGLVGGLAGAQGPGDFVYQEGVGHVRLAPNGLWKLRLPDGEIIYVHPSRDPLPAPDALTDDLGLPGDDQEEALKDQLPE